MKLTDTQLVLLSAASQREDRAVELPASLKGGAAQKVVAKLLTEGLVEEIRARGSLPVWRRDEAKGSFALRITKRGLAAIQLEDALGADAPERCREKEGEADQGWSDPAEDPIFQDRTLGTQEIARCEHRGVHTSLPATPRSGYYRATQGAFWEETMRKFCLVLLAAASSGMLTTVLASPASAETCSERYNQCQGIGDTARQRAKRCAYLLNRCLRTGCFRVQGEWLCGYARR